LSLKKTQEIMKLFASIFLFVCTSWACKQADIQPTINTEKVTLSGEWRYVGKFSHAADYKCTVCPEFDYGKSIYKVTFREDGTFDIRINLLIGKGNYAGKPDVNATATTYYGSVSMTDLQILNKPLETEADSEFKQNFTNVALFGQSTKAINPFGFDELVLSLNKPNSTSYLLFVRKK
jgi:hypothetical protein